MTMEKRRLCGGLATGGVDPRRHRSNSGQQTPQVAIAPRKACGVNLKRNKANGGLGCGALDLQVDWNLGAGELR
jgi:hypothetical protein